ncbi:MAG: putative DNA binding domain-containing protein, partial [Bacillota bacterium]|nr:putative DNA binding domain-containing protein [Bacillota bacterium]
MLLKDVLAECISYNEEKEWFEFKENVFNEDNIGEYISALSNSAAILGKPFAYMFWGISNKDHSSVGTSVNFDKEINNEPLQHYLARNLNPSISFYFDELKYEKKRIVALVVPAAQIVPTAYKNERYIRIGSSKENIKKYPEREAFLFSALTFGLPNINNKASEYQDLTFEQLLNYYASKNIILNRKTFKENLHLLTEDGKYNIMAQLLSDNSHIPARVAIFTGKTKSSKMYSVKEFGYKCLLYSLYDILGYGEMLNIPQADETDRIMERKEINLFDIDVYREAVINAFLHNKWVDLNEPMITVFSNRIEIMSRGMLAPLQTLSGFYKGHSIPVNDKLSEMFLQLHISE